MSNKILMLGGSVLLLTLGAAACQRNPSAEDVTAIPRANMTVSSPAFGNNQPIPAQFTCDGANMSPALEFKDVPERAQALVLIMDDPDASSGTFVHWVVANIPTTTTTVPEKGLTTGVTLGKNGTGNTGYSGPCPPAGSGTHHYTFTLYALNTTLTFDTAPDAAMVQSAMQGHVIEQTQLVGLYEK